MADVAIITANIGGHDNPHPQAEQTVGVDWYYVTESDGANGPPQARVYVLEADSPLREIDPRLTAKQFRIPPFAGLLGDLEYRYVIWNDAAAEITNPRFVEEALTFADGHPLTTWIHPRRDCIYDEAMMSIQEAPAKYGPMADELMAQVDAYRAEGYPPHHGLYATGTLVWNRSIDGGVGTREADVLGKAWLAEIHSTTIQDQLSLPVVAWRLGIPIATFPYTQFLSPRLQHRAVAPPDWPPPPRRHPDGRPYRVARNRWMIFHPHTRED